MGIHTTDAIVLRQYPYRETSALVTCLTDRYGKIKGLIKGLRGPDERYRSPMQPLTLNRIVFYDTRTSPLHLITQCELTAAYDALTRDLDSIRSAASCAELVDAFVELDEPQPATFELLRCALERISLPANARALSAIRIHFMLRLLRLVGFHPQLDECTGCTRRLIDGQGYWSVRQGGVMCAQCLHHDPHAQPVGQAFLRTLSVCAEADEPQALDPEEATVIHHRLEEFLRWRIERPLKAMGIERVGRTRWTKAAATPRREPIGRPA